MFIKAEWKLGKRKNNENPNRLNKKWALTRIIQETKQNDLKTQIIKLSTYTNFVTGNEKETRGCRRTAEIGSAKSSWTSVSPRGRSRDCTLFVFSAEKRKKLLSEVANEERELEADGNELHCLKGLKRLAASYSTNRGFRFALGKCYNHFNRHVVLYMTIRTYYWAFYFYLSVSVSQQPVSQQPLATEVRSWWSIDQTIRIHSD